MCSTTIDDNVWVVLSSNSCGDWKRTSAEDCPAAFIGGKILNVRLYDYYFYYILYQSSTVFTIYNLARLSLQHNPEATLFARQPINVEMMKVIVTLIRIVKKD